ncbi:hypothetical protein ABBQ38_009658 [Trebouxia sp. C0009 RCD-2024]
MQAPAMILVACLDQAATLQAAVVHGARRASQIGEASTALFHSLSAALSGSDQEVSRQKRALNTLAAAVTDWSEDKSKREALVQIGRSVLIKWLLSRALDQSHNLEQVEAEHALLNLLADATTASAVLNCEGALPKLLQLLRHTSDAEKLAGRLLTASAQVTLTQVPSLDEIKKVIDSAKGESSVWVQQVAVRFMGNWAEASVINCGKIATMQGGQALTEIAAAAASAGHNRQLEYELVRTMALLARDCPLTHTLGIDTWLRQLLYIAADAAAMKHLKLASQALDGFSLCLWQLGEGQADSALAGTNVFPLLHHLSKESSQLLRRSIITAVGALSHPDDMHEDERQLWTEQILQWMCSPNSSTEIRFACGQALTGLASVSGTEGLQIAHKWLADLLVYFSKDVTAYSAVRLKDEVFNEATDDSFRNAVAVMPLFARSVAAELRDASDQVGAYQEPPLDPEHLITSAMTRTETQRRNRQIADSVLIKALKTLCALVSHDDAKQRWLQSTGILGLLQRLTVQDNLVSGAVPLPAHPVLPNFGENTPLRLWRESARIIAMISADAASQTMIRHTAWVPWLQAAATIDDCKLSSHAARALLHLESARCFPSINTYQFEHNLYEPQMLHRIKSTVAELQSEVEEAVDKVQSALGNSEAVLERQASHHQAGPRLVMRDGVHLFDPTNPHHKVLAQHGAASTAPGSPLVDVVFVHGIRGGAFATWRREGVQNRQPGHKPGNLDHPYCWPSTWLPQDVPEARLLSMEYAAPASGWEAESMPLHGTVGQLLNRLIAAGVGQRPVIFVTHSMGGVLVKEMLAKAFSETAPAHHRQLADSTSGLVFYACPHLGSNLANIGWNLRYVGASPAASVVHLKPGKHLEDVNNQLQRVHEQRGLPVLSFGEGASTTINTILPKLTVVPEASSYPGYGEFVLLEGVDHINVCKPPHKTDPAYVKLMEFLQFRVQESRKSTELHRCNS